MAVKMCMEQPITRKYVDSLPKIEVQIAGAKRSVRYDDAEGKIYSLDERGKWNGHVSNYKIPNKPAPTMPADQADSEPSAKEKEPLNSDSSLRSAVATAKQEELPVQTKEPWKQTPPSPPPTEQKSDPVDEPKAPGADDFLADDDILEDIVVDASGDNKKEKKSGKVSVFKIILYGCLGVAIVYGILATTFGQGRLKPQEDQNPVGLESTGPSSTEAMVETTVPDATEEHVPEDTSAPTEETAPPTSEPEEKMIQVLVSSSAIIPGQTITSDLFLVHEIAETEYRNLSATNGLYIKKDLANLEGLVATKYIPAGKYLGYDDVGRSFGTVNPWDGETAGYTLIALPVSVTTENFTYLNWGNSIDLTITVQTKQTNENMGNGEDTETTPDGLEHESSVVESMVIDTYKLTNVRIGDVQNVHGNSLYSRYYAIGSIPVAFQSDYLANLYQDPAKMLYDTPAYIIVCLTEEQASLISGLPQEAMTVIVSNPVSHSGSNLQNDIYILIRDVQDAIARAWDNVEEQSKNE